ncbi:hypothetical protein MTsN2n6_04580 [Vibrio fortis]
MVLPLADKLILSNPNCVPILYSLKINNLILGGDYNNRCYDEINQVLVFFTTSVTQSY